MRRIVFFGLLGLTLAWMIRTEIEYFPWTDDDAFISFRYARNLAQGNGLVYNLGERVEGYTNFLWTLLLAGSYHIEEDLRQVARAWGMLFSLATPLLLLFFPRHPEASRHKAGYFVPLLAAAIVALSPNWSAWAAGGLENVLSAFLVTLGLWLYLEATRRSGWRLAAVCGFVFALAALNHPTNSIFAITCTLHLLWLRRWRVLLAFGLPLLLLLALHAIWRWSYYGELLPNTFYAKTGLSRWVVWRGLRYLGEWAAAYPLAMLALIVVSFLAVRGRLRSSRTKLLSAAIAIYLLYVLAVGGEQFPAFRMSIVLLPLFAVLVRDLTDRWLMARASWQNAPLRVLALLIFLTAAATVPLYFHPRLVVLEAAVAERRTDLSITAATMLKQLLPPQTLFAHSGAGLLAYYTNFRWIDTLGLTDHHIARTHVENLGRGAAGHEKGDGAYVLARRPDYIMFPGYPISNVKPTTKGGREMQALPEFRRLYRPRRYDFKFRPEGAEPQKHSIYLWELQR